MMAADAAVTREGLFQTICEHWQRTEDALGAVGAQFDQPAYDGWTVGDVFRHVTATSHDLSANVRAMIATGEFPFAGDEGNAAGVEKFASLDYKMLRIELNDEQRTRALFPVDDSEWRRWANQHSYQRQGVSFEELDEGQREAAFDLMEAGLSAKGFRRSRDIMRLNYTLGEITGNFEELDEWFYYFTVMGEPSEDRPWGWQLDGHHLIVNYFVLGDQVVMTPTFMGSEPVIAESGKYKGVAVMQDERRRGIQLMRALDPGQRSRAVIAEAKQGNNALAEAFRDNAVLDYSGILASEFTAAQRGLLLALIEEFVGNMDEGHAKVKMKEVRDHLDGTYFAWIGDFGDDSTFYYRVQSPVVLIEFDHQRPVFMRLPRVPTLQHVHSVIRTPNGNDYGKNLLRKHYEQSHRAALEGNPNPVATLRDGPLAASIK